MTDPEPAGARTSAVHVNADGDVTIGGDVVGRDKITLTTVIRNIFQITPTAMEKRRDQLILLNKVRTFWIKGVLEKSVHGAAVIELGKTMQAGAVERPWEIVIETPDQPDQAIAPGTSIAQVFDELERALLILGAPGSGKTTTLLELARHLLDRAEVNRDQPIPVVLNLSSWAARRPPLMDWLVEELSGKYQIPRKTARAWLEAHDLLPLLDGLDEVSAEHREACVEAINLYRQEHGLAGLAVCSRAEDYARLAKKLKLSGAIAIQPLTEAQVEAWLAAAGDKLAGVRTALKTDAALQELAKSPLMLSVMSLAWAERPEAAFTASGSIEAHRSHIFAAYVRHMLSRRGPDKRYTPEQTVRWLAWLGRKISQHDQTLFQVEQMQPSYLPKLRYRWLYSLSISLIAGLAIGLGLSLYSITASRFDLSLVGVLSIGLNLITGVLSGVFGGLIAGIAYALRVGTNRPGPEARSRSSPLWPAIGCVTISLIVGAGLGVIWFANAFIEPNRLITRLDNVLALSVFWGAWFALIGGFLFGILLGWKPGRRRAQEDIQTVEIIRWSWPNAIQGVTVGGGLGFAGGWLMSMSLFTATAGFSWLLGYRMTTLSDLTWYLLTFAVPYSIYAGIAFSLIGAFLGLLSGLHGRRIGRQSRPNEGVRRSVRNAIIAGLVFGASGAIIGAVLETSLLLLVSVAFGAEITPASLAQRALTSAMAIGLGVVVGLSGALWHGGLTLIQHFTLRLILFINGEAPWDLPRFLDYCADRILLQKVGGGYIFIHRMLQEYIAGLEPLKH